MLQVRLMILSFQFEIVLYQLIHRYAKDRCDFYHHRDMRNPFALFHSGHVGLIDAQQFAKFACGQSTSGAQATQFFAKFSHIFIFRFDKRI